MVVVWERDNSSYYIVTCGLAFLFLICWIVGWLVRFLGGFLTLSICIDSFQSYLHIYYASTIGLFWGLFGLVGCPALPK